MDYAIKCGAIVTTERTFRNRRSRQRGMQAVSESAPCPVVRHGVNDEFGRSAAALKVLEHYKVNAAGIVEKALEAVALKK